MQSSLLSMAANLSDPSLPVATVVSDELNSAAAVRKFIAKTLAENLPLLLDELSTSQLLPLKATLMTVTNNGLFQTICPISDISTITKMLRSSMEKACIQTLKATQAFAQSHIFDVLSTDLSATNLEEFSDVSTAVRKWLAAWFARKLPVVRGEISRHVAVFFDQVPTNTVCSTVFKLDDGGNKRAEFTCDGVALWNTVSQVLVEHTTDATTVLERMMYTENVDGDRGIGVVVSVDARAEERALQLANENLGRANETLLSLIGASADDVDTSLQIFEGHRDDVLSVCISGDDRLLVTGSKDKMARLWNIETSRCIRVFAGHSLSVNSVCLTGNDDTWLVTGSHDSTAKLWDVGTGRCIRTFKSHTKYVSSVFPTANGTYLVTGSWDKTAKLWQISTGGCLRTFKCSYDQGVVNSVCLTRYGTGLVTGSHDKTAKLWDVETGRHIRTFTGHTSLVLSVCLTSDDKRLVTGSYDKTAKMWDVQTGECIRTFSGHEDAVRSVCVSSCETRIVTGSADKTAKVWDVETGLCISTCVSHKAAVRSVCLTSGGNRLVTGSADNTALMWRVHTTEAFGEFVDF